MVACVPFRRADGRIELQADVGPGLLRFFAAAVREDHPVDDDHGLAAAHVTRDPGRRKSRLGGVAVHLERRDASFLRRRRVHGRRFVLRVDRAPERSEHPARTVRFLPGRERAPASHVLKVHFLVAEERRLVQRRLVIGPARRLRIEQVDAALLARRGDQLAALVHERHWGVVRIEVAFPEPVPVPRRVVVLELHLAVDETHPDDAVGVARRIARRVVGAVTGRRPCGAGRIERDAAAPPCATAPRVERHHFVLRIVEIQSRDRDAGICVRHPERSAVERQRPPLARVEHVGRFEVFAGRRVQDVQHPVARDEIDSAPALRVSGADDRRVAAAARLEEPELPRILRSIASASAAAANGRVVRPVLLPENLAGLDVEGVEVVGDPVDDADLSCAAGGRKLTDHEDRHQRVQCARLVAGFQRPEQLQVPHVLLREDLLVPGPPGSLVVAAVRQPVDELRGVARLRAERGFARQRYSDHTASAQSDPAAERHSRDERDFLHESKLLTPTTDCDCRP